MKSAAILMTNETELEIAVRDGEATVARQREILLMLRRTGYVGGRAERLLAAFEARLAEHRKRLSDLQEG